MAYAQFINTEYLKVRGLVDENVDDKLLMYNIETAQATHTQIILGENLYLTLMDKIVNNTLAGFYLTLVNNFVQPSLLQWTIYEALPWINFKITNKSVLSQTTDNSTVIATADLKWLRDLTEKQASFSDQRIKEYIIQNPSEFPEYYAITKVAQIPPSNLTGFTGFYTSSRNRRGYWDDNNTPGCCPNLGINLGGSLI